MKALIALFTGLILLTSCNPENDILGKMNDYDQGPMLQSLGNNLILPAYEQLSVKAADLENAIVTLTENPTQVQLDKARLALKEVRIAWQGASPFQFGPAESVALSTSLNVFPVDERQIERNIENGSYDLNSLSNFDAKGFQAIAYLLHTPDMEDSEILTNIEGNTADYLNEVAKEIASKSFAVYAKWNPEGEDYLGVFTSEDAYGVNMGSSVALLVNAMNQHFERNTRDGKIGIPVGIRSLGEPIPHAVEAYYAGYSVELLQANLEAYGQLYHGVDGDGIDDYLKAIQATTTENDDLAEEISAQFQALHEKADVLTDPLPQQIESDATAVQAVFAEMQRLIVLFKTDMASAMGVVITYQDNDGD